MICVVALTPDGPKLHGTYCRVSDAWPGMSAVRYRSLPVVMVKADSCGAIGIIRSAGIDKGFVEINEELLRKIRDVCLAPADRSARRIPRR